MKMKSFNGVTRRRGTTIAAAALSVALVAPFVHPVANAQENQPVDGASATADAIQSPGQADQKGTISGSVKEIVEAKVGFGNVQDAGKALEGVKVYAQWYEGENTQHSSPVYYTETDANGNFIINMAPYTDASGITREFRADASVGLTTGDPSGQRDERREKIRVWTELPEELSDTYRLVHQPAAGIFPGIGANTTPGTQGDGQWKNNRITGMTIQYAQKDKLPQHLPEDKRVESEGTGLYGLYRGRAFWNLDVLQGALNHNTVSAFGGKDIPAAGMKVVGSYLTDEAVQAIHDHVASTYAGKTLRGNDWTVADEQGLQKWINEQIAGDPEGWIAETVTTTTAADGTFNLYWKGIYGQAWDRKGTVPEDKFHTVAASRDEGTFVNGNSGSKHVNMDWSYVQVLDKDGNELPDNVGMLYPWSLGQWAGPNTDGANAQLFGGDGAEINKLDDKYLRWNVALAPQALKFDVVDKNTTDNWATIGDTVQTDTEGLPISDDMSYYIEWFDKDGKSVKKCDPVKADAATTIPSCPFEVPTDAKTGDTFTAHLKVADGDADPENDLVLALDAFAVSRDYLEYDEVDAKVDEEATSQPKFDNPASEPEETKPEQAKFELGKLPEGVTEDQVSVDEYGVVTFTPNADQVGKTFEFPVVMRDQALQVPVYDENGDPVMDDSGEPKTQARIVARADATFNVAEATANTVEPKYEDKLVVPGEETKSSPTFTDKDGKDVEVPEDSKFAISDDFTAPEGYEVKIDENTGEITVTSPDGSELDKDTVEEFDVPVTVTYPDGTTDDAKAKFKLDTDGDGKPDTEDEDDDNDGISDKEEEDKGSNPKDKGSIPATPIEPGNPTDAATFDPSYEDKLVVPGEETKSSPTFTDKDGKDVEVPEDSKFAISDDFTAPEGYEVKIDENTGEITVTSPDGSELDKDTVEEFDVPVTVTYPDGTTDDAKAKFKLDTDGDGKPDTEDEDDDNDGISDKEEEDKGSNPKDKGSIPATPIEPGNPTDAATFDPSYEDGSGKPGDDVTVPAPEFKDNDGNPAEAPEGTEFTPGDNAPDGVTVDENTGEITVPVPEDAKPGDKITVPVDVTYPDGSKDTVDVTVTVGEPDAPDAKDNETFEPDYEDGSGKPGEDVKVPAPEFKDNDGNPAEAPEGTEFTPGDNAPDGVTVDENTGEITVPVPEDAKPGDKITVPVDVTYPDGSKDTVDVPVTVGEPKDNSGSSDGGSSIPGGSSNVDWERCAPAAAGLGLPLLFLLPIGLASQMNIPGFSPLVKQVSAQIDGINRQLAQQNVALQKQLGIYNGPLAKQASQIDLMLKKVSSEAGRIGGGIALAAAGALALGLLINSCAPGAGSSSSSSSSK